MEHEPDWHVEALSYTLVTEEYVSFAEDAARVTLTTADFEAALDHGSLTVRMRSHFTEERQARIIVEPHLRAWEAHAALQAGRPEFRFRFASSHLIDRSSPPGTHSVKVASTIELAGSLTAHTTRHTYPEPPTPPMVVTPEVEMLLARWGLYARGGDTLLDTAYFCLTVFEHSIAAGTRSKAAARLGVSRNILSTLGTLTAHGDPHTARKFTGRERPLTGGETAWVEAALRALIRRAAEVAAAGTPDALPPLTMHDLPALLPVRGT